jgi:mannose-1-phosphate guanylyltransferase
MTLGIKPTRPETGYGYIQIGDRAQGDISKVKTFTEKPDLEIAKMFLESGEFFWNSGIFIWSTKAILEALKLYAPDLTATFEKGKDAFGTPTEQAFIDSQFPSCPNISIDYAVMERASNVYVECVDFGWSDLGTWSSLYDNSPKNREQNVTQNCRVLAYNSTGNIIAVNSEKLVVVNGLKDYIVADADDVLLICPKSEEQHIKLYVNDVKLAYDDKYL